MEIIQSLKNPKVKSWVDLKTKQGRNEQGFYIIEGLKLVEEALKSGQDIHSMIIEMDKDIPYDWNAWLSHVNYFQVSHSIVEKLTDTKAPQGYFAILKQPQVTVNYSQENSFLLLVDEIQDPGNLGTIIRSADAAGVHGIILGNGSVDPYNPKVIRSAMGSMFHIPFMIADLSQVIPSLQEEGFHVVGTSPSAENPYFHLDFKQKIAVIVGNESRGLSDMRKQQVDEMVTIPFIGKAESLNVATATTILLFERVRQLLK